MAIQVIGGNLRGRALFAGRGRAVRPTLSTVRGALFNILGERVAGAWVLDLFAGSGALAIEALSRGAARAVLLEIDAQAHRVVARNLEALGLTDRAETHRTDARLWLRGQKLDPYEILFLDPPWDGTEGEEVFRRVAQEPSLHPDALVCWEYSAKSGAPAEIGFLKAAVEKRYGDTGLTVYRRVAP